MRVHHINCATMCPTGRRLVEGEGGPFERARMVCHCLLVESGDGLVLVDTGLGLDDCADPRRLAWAFRAVVRPRLDPEETAARTVERLGFRRRDVRHIVLTHLDVDHAGGLPDFPDAQVHVFAAEHDAAMSPRTANERHRYVPAQWAHGPRWVKHAVADGERWLGFERVRALSDPEVLLVPLAGHTRGHCGVAVRTGDGWLLHAGDAYFFHAEVDAESPRCTPALRWFQRALAIDDEARLANQRRLRELARDHAGEVTIVCAHSPVDFERARLADRPAADQGALRKPTSPALASNR